MHSRPLAALASSILCLATLGCDDPKSGPASATEAGTQPQPVACTAEDIYGSDAMLRECWINLGTLGRALEKYQASHRGQTPDALANLPATLRPCPADGGTLPAMRVKNREATIYCPGKAHARLGLPEDFPRYEIGKGVQLHPTVHPKAGSISIAGARPGMTAAALRKACGASTNLGRPPHILQFLETRTLSTAILNRDDGIVALVEGTAIQAQDHRPFLTTGDSQQTVTSLLGKPTRVGPTGRFPPQGQQYDLDGLELHIDVEHDHVYRLALTTPGYRPNWKLWNR